MSLAKMKIEYEASGSSVTSSRPHGLLGALNQIEVCCCLFFCLQNSTNSLGFYSARYKFVAYYKLGGNLNAFT